MRMIDDETKRQFIIKPQPPGSPRRWIIEATDYTTNVLTPRGQRMARSERVEVVEAAEIDRLRAGLEVALRVSFVVGMIRLRASRRGDVELAAWGERLTAQIVAIREVLSPGLAALMARVAGENPASYDQHGSRRSDGLTDEEGVAADALVDAVNAFAKLPSQHPDETRDFCDGIHKCQDQLIARIARRVYPDGWPTYSD